MLRSFVIFVFQDIIFPFFSAHILMIEKIINRKRLMTCIHYITTERKKKSKNIKIDIRRKLILCEISRMYFIWKLRQIQSGYGK